MDTFLSKCALSRKKMKQTNALPMNPSLNTNPNGTQLGRGTTKIAAEHIFIFHDRNYIMYSCTCI